MMPKLFYPVKPFSLNQGFGVNGAYYAKFLDSFGNPIKGHMGLDMAASHGTPVYASHDGSAHFVRDSHGGEGIHITGDGFETVYWHLCGDTDPAFVSPIPLDGTFHKVKAGDLIGYADNTGAPYESNGTHLHFALVPLDASYNKRYPANGFDGCVDPTPYFNGFYAQDAQKLFGYYQTLISILKAVVGALTPKP